jgi:tetratricopeptide (TPR) repeat protein
LASLELSQGNISQARGYAQRSVQLSPGDAAAHLLLGSVALTDSDPSAAREQFALAQQLAPQDPTPHLKLAQVNQSEKKWSETERELETALSLDPHSPEILGALVDFLVSRNERPTALDRVQKYLATYSDDAKGHLILGSLLSDTSGYDQAKMELQRAIQLDPKLLAAYLRLAKLEQDRGNVDGAIAGYERALALQPKLVPLLTMIGNLYLDDKGDLATARNYYERALSIDSDFAAALGNLAYVQSKQGGDLNVALGMAQRAKQLAPNAEAITDTLAWVQYLKGYYGESVPMLKQCVQKDPKRAIYRYHLGMALLATGDKREAKSELDAALHLKLSPDDAQRAQDTLAQIQSN